MESFSKGLVSIPIYVKVHVVLSTVLVVLSLTFVLVFSICIVLLKYSPFK